VLAEREARRSTATMEALYWGFDDRERGGC
jgi:hypothetical protein